MSPGIWKPKRRSGPKEMKLSRWNNTYGVSAGTWRVVEVPGLILLRQYFYGYWSFALSPKSADHMRNPRKFYGTPSELISEPVKARFPEAARVISSPLGSARFSTRREAVDALEVLLAKPSGSALSVSI